MKIELKNMDNDNFGAGLSILYNLLHEKSKSTDNRIEINYKNCRFYNSFALAGIAAIIESWQRAGHEVINDLSQSKSIFESYADIVGFPSGKIFEDDSNIQELNKFGNKTYIPIVKFNVVNREAILSAVGNIVKTQAKVDNNLFTALAYFIDELTNNIAEHSGEKHGLIFAQYYSTKKYLDLCMCDAGVGFYETYNRSGKYPDILNDKDAIEAVLQGKSTKDQSITRGFGLSTSRRALVEGLNGKFFIASGNHFFIKAETVEGVYETPNGEYFQGCFIAMRIPLQANAGFNMANYYE